jgi:putative transposase
VVVHPADIQDRDGAKLVLERITHTFSRLRRRGKVTLEIVKRTDDLQGFKVLPKRWIVERTFGWLGRWRRLSKDDEYLTNTSETMIKIAMIGIMTRRLAGKEGQ